MGEHPGGMAPRTEQGPMALVCFHLHGQEYAADIGEVVETLVVHPVTRVFLTPPWLLGIMNLRGDMVAVLDLAQLLGLPPTAVSPQSRIVLVRHGGRRAGLMVDRLAELRTLDPACLEPAPPTLSPEVAQLLVGIATVAAGGDAARGATDDAATDVVRVLDLAALFESETLRSLEGTR